MFQHTTCDLFISYAPADDEWVQGYLLPALGLPPERTITREHFRPGAPIPDEFERAVMDSRYTLLVISRAYVADEWTKFAGKLASYLSVDEQHDRLIPLLRERFDVPPQLRFREPLDCSDPAKWDAEVQRLLKLLDQPEPDVEYIPCPYPGMVPFTEKNAEFFYGREDEILQMIQQVRDQPLLFVIGPSGSGKSSLVFAGLLPQLASRKYFPKDFWQVRQMRPGAQPTKTLRDLLAEDQTQQAELELVVAGLTNPPPIQRLLLVIDQFEEIFTQNDLAEQTSFFETLQSYLSLNNSTLLLTMRADFYPALMSSDLWPIPTSQRLEIAPLRGKALREAIQRPAFQVGVYLERDLLESLRRDAADAPGSLPLIQETMRMLWDRRQRRLLTLSAYERMGRDGQSGLAVAVASKADDTLEALTSTQREIARRIFVSLVQISEGCPDTRRQQPLAKLREDSNDLHNFDLTLEHLVKNRLLTVSDDDQKHGPMVDISHEALITGWPKLHDWLLEDRASLLQHRHLQEDADEWRNEGCDVSFLYGGWRLAEAQGYAKQHPDELSHTIRDFLAASAEREAARVRARYMGQAAGGAVGAALGYGLAFPLLLFALDPKLPRNTITISFLSWSVIGALVGLCIGIGLWLFRRYNQARRVAATGLIGALTNSVMFAFFLQAFLRANEYVVLQILLSGAVVGVSLGLGAGLNARWRLIGIILGGLLGILAFTVIFAKLPPNLLLILITPIAGFLLGACTAFGFEATAVEEDDSYSVT